MSKIDRIIKELSNTIRTANDRATTAYDTTGTVTRIEGNTAWVHLLGGISETPVRMTIDSKAGDKVQVRVGGGMAWITGNDTSPPTDDQEAIIAQVSARLADKKAVTAGKTANQAREEIKAVAQDLIVTNQLVAEKATIVDLDAEKARINQLVANSLTADSAVIKDLEADTAKIHSLTAEQLSSATAYIAQLIAGSIQASTIIADNGRINNLETNALTAQSAEIQNLQADTAKIHSLTADQLSSAVAYVATLIAQNIRATDLTADHATVGSLDSNYAKINLANVNNAWIENGIVKDASIADAKIIGVSANKLTAGTIDASNITVTNLNASNITTGSITVDGITIDVENNEASIDGEYIEDGTITLNGLAQEVTDKIDGAIETFTGSAVPTLNNYPASSWTTTKIKDSHIGDVYYVLNTENTADGYCYRFAKAGNTYKWVLIKDSDVTAALSRLTTAEGKISGLESFESTTSSWITNTDEELSSIKSNHTSLVTVVNKTVKETVQLWFTKANTTAPSKPTAQVTNNSPTGSNSYNKWNLAVPQYNSSYPNYYYCYQWKYVDGTYRWSAVTRDIAMGESQSTARTAASDASTAVSTAETASTNASNAVSTANTASTNASTALSTANTANTNASTALSTANTAASDASSAVSTANTANSNASSAVTTANAAQTTANANIKSSVQLWFTKANTTAPSKPTAHVTTNDASKANQWNIAVPTYNGTYPNYFYCYEYQKGDGTYAWSNVVYDRATTENQSNSRSALSQVATKVETSTFNTLSQTVDSNTANITSLSNVVETKADSSTVTTLSNTVNEVSQTATGNSSKISSLTNTLGTNADGTTKAGDIVHRTSAVEQDLSGFKTTVSKTYHKTSDFNTYKAANDTAVAAAKKAGDDAQADLDEYKGTVSETYATKSSLTQTAEGIRTDVSSTYETKTDASAKLTEAKGDATTKANKALTDAKADTTNKLKSYYTKTETDSAITQKAGEISLSVAQTEISKIEVGGRNLFIGSNQADKTATVNGLTCIWDKDTLTLTISGTNTQKSKAYGVVTFVSTTRSHIYFNKGDTLTFKATLVSGSAEGLYLSTNFINTSGSQYGLGAARIGKSITYTFGDTHDASKPCAGVFIGAYPDTNTVDCVLKIKLEKGNKATDWTPAPEDLEAYTDSQVSAAKAEIKVTTDGISTEVAKKTDKETIISTIRQSAESVKIKASQVEIDGTATFNAIKDSIENTVDTAVDGIEIGGRNLARGTAEMVKGSGAWSTGTWINSGSSNTYNYTVSDSPVPSVNKGVLVTTKVANTRYGVCQDQCPMLSKKVTFSVWAKGTAGGIITLESVWWSNIPSSIHSATTVTATGEWQYISFTTDLTNATVPNDKCSICYLYWKGDKVNDTCVFVAPKLEYGTKATAWSPAPEDIEAAAVAEEQYIYISKASGTTSVDGTTTWVTEAGDKQNTWSTKRPTYNTSYPVLFVAKQKKVVSGTVTCTTPIKDDTTTIIDGGHITTGTIDASVVNVTNIKATEIKTGKVNATQIDSTNLHVNAANIDGTLTASQINAQGLSLGMNQITGLSNALSGKADTEDIPTNVSDLTNDSGFQNATQVNTAITSKGYQTSQQVESAITGKGYQTSAQVETAITSKDYATNTALDNEATARAEAVAEAAKTATDYLHFESSTGLDVGSNDSDSKVNIHSDYGVRIYDEDGKERNQINSDGMSVKDGNGNTIARFGSIIDLGLSGTHQVRISDQTIDFVEQGKTMAYMAEDKGYFTNQEIGDALYLGNYSLRQNSEGKLVIGRRR